MNSSFEKLPIFLVHGFWDKSSIFNDMASTLKNNGFDVFHALDLKPNDAKNGIQPLSLQLEKYIYDQIGIEKKYTLIGFSMGGIVCRYYLQKIDTFNRCENFISISSPHFGSLMAHLFQSKGSIEMRPSSAFLNLLNNDMSKLKNINVLSIWAKFDTTIIPNSSSVLPIGTNISLPFGIHHLMPKNKKVIYLILKFLRKN